jgi:hypothetical protein
MQTKPMSFGASLRQNMGVQSMNRLRMDHSLATVNDARNMINVGQLSVHVDILTKTEI